MISSIVIHRNKMFVNIRIILVLIIIFFCYSSVYAQYEPGWNKTYGGLFSEWAKAVVETADHGLVIVGYKEVQNQNKYLWVVKTDKDGNLLWEKTFKEHYISSAESVIETHDESIVIAGSCVKDGDYFSECWIVKLDMFGNKLWDKIYGSRGDDGLNCIIETTEHGFAAVGFTDRSTDYGLDFLALLLDENGDKIWEKTFGGTKEDYAMSIVQTTDGGLAMAGYTRSTGTYQRGSNRSFWVIKTDMDGFEIWDGTFGESWWDVAAAIIETSDKGLAVVGYSKSAGVVNYDMLVIKLNSDGQELWRKTFGGVEWDEATSIVETYDRGLLIGGFTRSREANFSNFWIIKLDEKGYELWNNIFERSSVDFANDIIQTYDYGFVVAGSTLQPYSQTGWQGAILKFANEERPHFTFKHPVGNTAISNAAKYNLRFEIETTTDIERLMIFVNDDEQKNLDSLVAKNQISRKGIKYRVSTAITLKAGQNQIMIEGQNMHGTGYSDKQKIDLINMPKVLW